MKLLPKLLAAGLFLEAGVLGLSYLESGGNSVLFFSAAARLSGRVSLLYFGMLFIYATLYPSVEKKSTVLLVKYTLAKNFAILHIIHWFLLAIAVSKSNFELVPSRLIGGGIAYALIVLLPFIIKQKIFSRLPLQLVFGVYLPYVWLIFFMTYLSRVTGSSVAVTGSMAAYRVLMDLTILLMLWRIAWLIKNSFIKKQ
jgi:hypothetical protein